MNIYTSENIRDIDSYAEKVLNIPTERLMERAGRAIADEAVKLCSSGSEVLILAGKGNNGGDGYAAAVCLMDKYNVKICDIFSLGQSSDAGKHFLNTYLGKGGVLVDPSSLSGHIAEADLIIDAVFGVGFRGDIPEWLLSVAKEVNRSTARVLAVDMPLGVYSDTAETASVPIRADVTVALTGLKPCHLSYPSAEVVGRIATDRLGLDEHLSSVPTEIKYRTVDAHLAAELLPKRAKTSNKGSFGRSLHFTGSSEYPGAAHLSLEGALRTGVGYVCHVGRKELNIELRGKFPEALYVDTDDIIDPVSRISSYSSVLVGCGSGVSEETYLLCKSLIQSEGGALVLDADAINSITKFSSPDILLSSGRKLILTPHPLELSRLFGITPRQINSSRISVAEEIAKKYGIILLLKGAGTVITDGERTFINSTGSSALAKAGSGDVLSGIISSLVATEGDLLSLVALAAYLHGRAADELSADLSEYGVIPSDLPRRVARIIADVLR